MYSFTAPPTPPPVQPSPIHRPSIIRHTTRRPQPSLRRALIRSVRARARRAKGFAPHRPHSGRHGAVGVWLLACAFYSTASRASAWRGSQSPSVAEPQGREGRQAWGGGRAGPGPGHGGRLRQRHRRQVQWCHRAAVFPVLSGRASPGPPALPARPSPARPTPAPGHPRTFARAGPTSRGALSARLPSSSRLEAPSSGARCRACPSPVLVTVMVSPAWGGVRRPVSATGQCVL